MKGFNGFPQDAPLFFIELALNNNKEFFEANRYRWEKNVRDPMRALVAALADTVLDIDPTLNVNPISAVSRLRRDTRFSKDKTPYRDHIWYVFKRSGEDISQAFCFFMEFGSSKFSHGLGMYEGNKPMMDGFRNRILAKKAEFIEISDKAQRSFPIYGEDYKREPYKDVDEKLKPWLNKKYFGLIRYESDLNIIFKPSLVEMLSDGMKQLKPIYKFLMDSPNID